MSLALQMMCYMHYTIGWVGHASLYYVRKWVEILKEQSRPVSQLVMFAGQTFEWGC